MTGNVILVVAIIAVVLVVFCSDLSGSPPAQAEHGLFWAALAGRPKTLRQ